MGGWINRDRNREGVKDIDFYLPPPFHKNNKKKKWKGKERKNGIDRKAKAYLRVRGTIKYGGSNLRCCTNTYMILKKRSNRSD